MRALENVIGHACMMTLGETGDVQNLPEYLRAPTSEPAEQAKPPADSLEDHERLLIVDALARAKGNQSQSGPFASDRP
ncbi:MAG: hypothetical protein M3Y27_27740 [Acidobacteriota bacterium]|nr:hypothetical protein [Acidobacteriota bacterium]